MKEQYTRTGEGFLLAYAINSRESLDEIRTVYQEISAMKGGKRFPVILLGNKCDLEEERMVSIQGQSICLSASNLVRRNDSLSICVYITGLSTRAQSPT